MARPPSDSVRRSAGANGSAGEEARGGSQVVVGERAQVRREELRLLELGGGGADRVAGAGEIDHAREECAMITAFIMFTVEPGRVKQLAEQLLEIDGVAEVYSVAGPFDLIAIVRVKEHEALSDLVT